MNKRIAIFTFAVMMACSLSGCGKGKGSVSDNLLANNNDEIKGMDEINSMLEEKKNEVTYLTGDEATDAAIIAGEYDGSSDGSNADDLGEGVSDDNVGENNSDGEVTGEDGTQSDVPQVVVQDLEAGDNEDLDDYFSQIALTNGLTLANISGKDFKEVYVTFNAGNLNNTEITGEKRLSDGSEMTYIISDMDSLDKTKNLRLTISCTDKKGNSVDFGTLDILDSTNMKIVLSKNADGYVMYSE